ncbi:hypothetical protein ACGF12_14040 [Kitasatospora sp. NPDC048296]|uniref:hypothetical protein n=1 Tax=Kitasatospora sp. NPDC048296 TaxID=3364048 RepID=UPI003718664E
MGRRKPGRVRRERPVPAWRPPLLRSLQPPGAFYNDTDMPWWDLQPGEVPDRPGITEQTRRWIMWLAPVYGGQVPAAALVLDSMIARGVLHCLIGPGEVSEVPVDRFARQLATTWPAAAASGACTRELLHIMHADGFLLVGDDPFAVRTVLAQPPHTGGRWLFWDAVTEQEHAEHRVVVAAEIAAQGRDPEDLYGYSTTAAARLFGTFDSGR